jgi:hypothetical protein
VTLHVADKDMRGIMGPTADVCDTVGHYMKQISSFHYHSFEDSLAFGPSTTSITGINIILREMIDYSVYYSLGVSIPDLNQFNPNNRLRAALEARGLISPASDAPPTENRANRLTKTKFLYQQTSGTRTYLRLLLAQTTPMKCQL